MVLSFHVLPPPTRTDTHTLSPLSFLIFSLCLCMWVCCWVDGAEMLSFCHHDAGGGGMLVGSLSTSGLSTATINFQGSQVLGNIARSENSVSRGGSYSTNSIGGASGLSFSLPHFALCSLCVRVCFRLFATLSFGVRRWWNLRACCLCRVC